MLKRIITITNVGAIKNGTDLKKNLEKVTLVYAENGRGKSTFAALLNAASSGDAESILQRKTVGAEKTPFVEMRFRESDEEFSVTFDGTSWKGPRPNVYVFNQEFVERNVYAGTEVTAEQRASLLELALGDEAVAAQTALNGLIKISRTKANEALLAENALLVVKGPMTFEDYIHLPPIHDIEKKIINQDMLIEEAINTDSITRIPFLKKLPDFLSIDTTRTRQILSSTLEHVQSEAEDLVRQHLAKHKNSEQWIHTGFTFGPQTDCPYCGQSTESLPLLSAYNAYFSTAYTQLKANILIVGKHFESITDDELVEKWKEVTKDNLEIEVRWKKYLQFTRPTLNVYEMARLLREARSDLRKLVEVKKSNPLESIDEQLIDQAEKKISLIEYHHANFQKSIEDINSKINEFKTQLKERNIIALQQERQVLQIHKNRHEPTVVGLVDTVLQTRTAQTDASAAVISAKANLNELMAGLLEKFKSAINKWLHHFYAPFHIDRMGMSNGDNNYVIKLRGASVVLGRNQGDLNFHTALSEGDKRTLAFSFFLAKLFSDPKHDQATVVLDDVFTSLDHQRRSYTADIAVKIANDCSQLIVLGHDAYFLREVRRVAAYKKVINSITLCLSREAKENSIITDFDIEDFCASDYYKNYVLIERFISGDVRHNEISSVKKALRPLLEGYLYKTFPKRFQDGLTFGKMLDLIRTASSDNPLVLLQPHLNDLNEFNNFTAMLHHDTADGQPRLDAADEALRQMAQGALNFILARNFKLQ